MMQHESNKKMKADKILNLCKHMGNTIQLLNLMSISVTMELKLVITKWVIIKRCNQYITHESCTNNVTQ